MSFQNPLTIAKVIERIQHNDYVLPAIQREFVWTGKQIENLFDSLMRGYPIGSFLFWKVEKKKLQNFQFYHFMNRYHERDEKHNKPIEKLVSNKIVTAVLDGQQRLTALNIGLIGWYADKLPYYRWSNDDAFPKRKLYLNLLRLPEEDVENAYEFKLLSDNDLINNNQNNFWFLVGDILNFKDLKEVFNYCVDNNLMKPELKYPSETLVRLWEVMIKESVIENFLEEDQDLEKVLNIFIRVNSGGTILSYSDMLLSIATALWDKKDAREEIYDLVEDLNKIGDNFNYNKDFILKTCLVLTDIGAIEFRVSNFGRKNMLLIEDNWTNICKALKITTNLLRSWGFNRDTLVSNNAVIPLAYYINKMGNPSDFINSDKYSADRQSMYKWLIMAFLKRTFSGQPDSVLRKIRNVISKKNDCFPNNEILAELKPTNKSMSFDKAQLEGLLSLKYGQSYTFSVLALLYPWLKFDQNFHIDHIFPRSMFTKEELIKRGIPKEKWNDWLDHKDDLSNLQLLQGHENQQKTDKEFEEWLKTSKHSPLEIETYCEQHFIPTDSLSFLDFPIFLQKREKIIMDRLSNLLEIQ